MTKLPELQTPRLLLRRLCIDDADAIVAYRSLPEVARFQSWEAFGIVEANRLVESQSRIVPNTPGTWIQLALVEKISQKVIGDCGIHFRSDDHQLVEVGITLSPSHQRRGFAAEAIEAVLDYLFSELQKHRVIAITDAENLPAAALFERLGFRKEAHYLEHVWFKGAWGSEFLFALLRREWQDRNK